MFLLLQIQMDFIKPVLSKNQKKFRIIVDSEVVGVSGQWVQFVFLQLGGATAYTQEPVAGKV